MNQRDLRHACAGYSLVELAVVIVIIGIIMGGVMKGRDLVENARLKALVSQIQSYRVANGIFMDRYSALPGDFQSASDSIRSGLTNGDGDNIIRGEGLQAGSEALNYWTHLAAAELIPDPGHAEGIASFGRGVPRTKLGGGVTVSYDPTNDLKGHWFVVGTQVGNQGNGGLLTPKQASFLDHSFDNGDPTSGDFQCRGVGGMTGTCLTADGKYNLAEAGAVCVGYLKF